MGLWSRVKAGIQIVVGGHSQGRIIVKGATVNSGAMKPKQGEEWLHAYNTMPWLRASVSKIAQGVASLEWGITRTEGENGITIKRADIQKGNRDYRRKALAALEEEGKAEAIFDHPFLTLWKNPCPALPGHAARKLAQVYYEVSGEVFLVVDRGARDAWIKSDFTGRPLPTALWPVPPTWVKRVPTPDRPTFEIRQGGLQLDEIPMSEVLWLKDPDPVNPYGRGVGLFYSLSDELDADENAARMISYSFYNRNRPDLLISMPGASDQELLAFRSNWLANLQGVGNALKSHFVNVEAKVDQIGYDFREMQVQELRKGTRDTIRQVPGIPPEILGIQDQSNRSTIDAAEYIFTKHVIEPRAEIWREFLGPQLLAEYDPRAVLDYVSPVQEDKNFALEVATSRPEVVRVNEVRKLAGLPALTDAEGGKLFYVNGSFVASLAEAPAPAGEVPPGAAGPAGGGGGLDQPGFEGGINVPGALPFHLSVPQAAGSAESGQPAAAPGMPSAAAGAAAPPPPPAPGQDWTIQGPPRKGADEDAMKGVREAARRFRTGIADARLTPDQAILVSKWAERNCHELNLDLVAKTAPIPVSEKRPEEWARRALAYLDGFPTKAWDPMFGPWSEADTQIVDSLLIEKGHEDQPRDESGRWTAGGGSLAAGGGAAREGRDRRVDGDGAHTVSRLKTADLHSQLKSAGGFTVNPRTGEQPSEGFAVSRFKGREAKFEGHATPDEIAAYERKNWNLLSKPGVHIGGWYNTEDKHTYLDVSDVLTDKREANRVAWENKQIAFFDLKTKTEHKTVDPKDYDSMEHERELNARRQESLRRQIGAMREIVGRLGGKKAAAHWIEKDFNENQPRASDGKWTSGGEGEALSEADKVLARASAQAERQIGKDQELASRLNAYRQPGGSAEGTMRAPDSGTTVPEMGPSALHAILREEKTPVPDPPPFDPAVETDADGDGVTDSARVGVPADEVPPPPHIPRLPNLTPEERAVESAFADAFEKDPDGVAKQFLTMVNADPPPKFEADNAKMLFGAWAGRDMTPEARAEFRSTMNTALHQTADAIAKRAFLMHLDGMSDADKAKGLLVTVGGCGAGKGYALKTLAKEGFSDFNSKAYGAIWDSAGDQNATENPWLLREAAQRGVNVTFAYVSSDPEVAWADPQRGVVQRAGDPKDGRMVDAKVFADSYVIGARNHDAFAKAHQGEATFVFVRNGAKIEKLDGVPSSDLSRDRSKLHDFAVETIRKREGVAPRIRRGALVGQRIWPMGRRRKGKR